MKSMNSDGNTWTVVATKITWTDSATGQFMVKLTPAAAGVYTYRVTYDGEFLNLANSLIY